MHLHLALGGFSRAGEQRGDQPVLLQLHTGALQVSLESHSFERLVLKTAAGISILELKYQEKKVKRLWLQKHRQPATVAGEGSGSVPITAGCALCLGRSGMRVG